LSSNVQLHTHPIWHKHMHIFYIYIIY
jgi:hypothetical protein